MPPMRCAETNPPDVVYFARHASDKPEETRMLPLPARLKSTVPCKLPARQMFPAASVDNATPLALSPSGFVISVKEGAPAAVYFAKKSSSARMIFVPVTKTFLLPSVITELPPKLYGLSL